mgnify:CR=1 FL=1
MEPVSNELTDRELIRKLSLTLWGFPHASSDELLAEVGELVAARGDEDMPKGVERVTRYEDADGTLHATVDAAQLVNLMRELGTQIPFAGIDDVDDLAEFIENNNGLIEKIIKLRAAR